MFLSTQERIKYIELSETALTPTFLMKGPQTSSHLPEIIVSKKKGKKKKKCKRIKNNKEKKEYLRLKR